MTGPLTAERLLDDPDDRLGLSWIGGPRPEACQLPWPRERPWELWRGPPETAALTIVTATAPGPGARACRLMILCGDAPLPEGTLPANCCVMRTTQSPEAVETVIGAALAPLVAEPEVVHGVLVEHHDQGVLISGGAGVGKGVAALELLARGARLVADDAVELYRIGERRLAGRCPAVLSGYLEAGPAGVLDVAASYGPGRCRTFAPVDLQVVLLPPGATGHGDGRLAGSRERVSLLGVELPRYTLHAGGATGIMIEALARKEQLLALGIDPETALGERQRAVTRRRE